MTDVNPDLVKRLAELVDGDSWVLADLLVAEFPSDEWGDRGKENTGLRAALVDYEEALRREHGVELKASTMRHYRATALAWPEVVRTTSASFDAHARLRGSDGHQLMKRYLKRNKGRPLTKRDVMRYRADDKGPVPMETPEERFEKRIRSLVRALLLGGIKPSGDWWRSNAINTNTREFAAGVLRDLANDLLEGGDDD